MDRSQDATGGGAIVPASGALASTGSQPSTAGATPTPMVVDEGFFTQPVQAYFQFVQNNLTYINEGNIDAFRQEAEERHTQLMEQKVQQLYQEFEGICLSEIAHQRAEAERRHEHLVSEYAMSQKATEHEVAKLRQELSDANAKLKNTTNSVALEAEQRANQKVAHVTAQYEQRFSELKSSLEADCKRIVDETVEHARIDMDGFRKEERAAVQEIREECSRQENQAAELNYQLQGQVEDLMEKLNKYSAPEIKIDEVIENDDGQGGIALDMYMTPKSAGGTKAGVEPRPTSGMDSLALDAKERLSNLFASTPAGSAAPPKLPALPVQSRNQEEANNVPSVASPTIAASEVAKKAADAGLGLSGQQLVDLITRLTSKDADGEKPRTKEAETIKLNDMPAPEAYRHWRNHVRDEVKSCSDKPDEAWLWLNEVFDNKTQRDELEKKLQDPGKFITLDTKLSAALTRSAKGDLATKIHNFKDEKSKNGIQVRGRRVLLMFEDHFRTSEEAGSLYRVEDLLGVVRNGESVEDLRRFLNRWDATIAGMETPPDDLVLRGILLRQIRKCHLMKYDIEAFDRAPEKSEQKSYAFLLRNIRDLLDRERLRANRNRIVEKNKQTEKPQPAAPAQGGKDRGKGKGDRGRSRGRSQSTKGDRICYKFRDGKCEKGKDCPYKHVRESSRSGTPKKKGKGKGNKSSSPNRKSKEEMAKIPCTYFQQGKCRRGDKCFYKHEVAAAPAKDPKRTNSPAPKKKASAKAAPCIVQRYACIAKGKGLPKATKAMKDQSHRAVVFSSKVEYIKVPATGEQRKVVHRPRIYEKTFPDSESVPKPDKLVAHRAQVSARQLQELVKLFGSGAEPKCRFRCNDEEGGTSCNHCRALIGPKNKVSNTHLPTVATPASKDGCVWLVDTGSEQDLISEGMLKTAKATNRRVSDTPICLSTANGSTRADEVADVKVDALHRPFSPYILEETPAVLSVGVRCMEQGYSFVWPADGRPYFIRPDMGVIELNVDGRVPVIDSSCRVLNSGQFKKDCDLLRLFAMVAAKAEAAEEEGVDEGVAHDSETEYIRSRKAADLEQEACSKSHQFCHYPKNPFCKICQKARMMAPPARKKGGQKRLETKSFGDHIVADHTVIKSNVEEGFKGETVALVMKDIHTQFRHVYPSQTKSTESCVNAFNHFLSHKDEVGAVYTDNSRELIATISELGYRHQTSTEYVDSSKSFVEREIRHMLEGTRTNLVQAGLPLQYWPLAMQHFSTAVNATPQLNGDDAPWKLRFEEDFPGLLIPFGAKILFWNNPKRVDNTSGKTSPTANDGIFLGYHIQPGFAWKGEYLVAKMEALDYHAENGSITVQRARRVELTGIFEACYEKGSELPPDDPRRKFKGRTVFQGNNVRDQDSDHALFAELGSSPASMEAAKLLDAFGSQPGFSKAQADAIQAYIQALFTGVPTWLTLPRNRSPEHWEKEFWQPMVPLVLALYGHPDSGGIWENHLNSRINKEGWKQILPDVWQSIFYHAEYNCMLVVYVDDFKLAGPTENMDKAWASIKRAVNIDNPEPYDRYFGCQHVEFNNITLPRQAHPFAHVFDSQAAAAARTQHRTNDFWQHDPVNQTWTRYHLQPRKKLFEPGDEGGEFAKSLRSERVTMFDKSVEFKGLPVLNMHMSDENSAIVEDDMTIDQKIQTKDFWTGRTIFRYGNESGNTNQFALPSKNRPGPHRDKREAKNEKKSQRFKSIENVVNNKSGCMTKPVNLVRYDMSSFMESCVDAYCELAKVQKADLPVVATPFTEAGIARPTLDEKEKPGRLQPIASKVLMKILFAARMARPDLLRATQSLASRVTKWSIECDIALHRLVSYIKSTTDVYMEGFVGDSFDDCQLWLFADADHAGEHDSKSTSGCAMFLVGPNTYFPLNAFSKKQTVVANSSTEAEVVSANHALRAEGIPMLALLEQLGIFKKMSQKAGINPKPNTLEQYDPVFTRIDKEIDEIRYGNVEGGLSAANINGLKAHFPEFYQVKFMEDNQASITVMGTGNSSTMRYANKTQNICFKWMKQLFENEQFDLINVGTLWQTADILTKPFTSPSKWEHALRLMAIGKSWVEADKTKVRSVDSKPACPANANDQGGDNGSNSVQRLLIEFCCSSDSKLCTPRQASKGCRLIRVTEHEDGTTQGCRKWLAQEVQSFRESNPEGEILLYASLPCVGGSPWGYINGLTDKGAERIEQQQKDFTKLFKSLQKVIHEIDGPHFSIAFELSKNCKYWKWPMVQSFLKKQELKLYPFHGCQFGVVDLNGNPMKKGWMIATNMDELSSLSEYVCDGSHTHGQSRGEALKLAENYTFTLTDFIHECFRSRADRAQTAKTRKRLALPAMSRRSDDSKMSIADKMNVRALKSAGLKTVPQQSNMSEWLAFRKCLDVEGDRHAGWEDIFSTVLASSTILASGNRVEDLEIAAGFMQCYTAQSMATDALTQVPWAKELLHLSELEHDALWDMKLPTEYVPGTSRPAVDVVPTIYVVTSDSTLALITGKGKTLKKYTMKEDLAARKSDMVLEIGHDMLWGKDLQQLCKANVAMVKDLMSKYKDHGSAIRVISVIVWSGNEICGEHGVEPLQAWGQRDPQGDWNAIMDRVKGNLVWWNQQLKDLGVDQAALISAPDPLVYGLSLIFTTFMDRLKTWFDQEILGGENGNERLRWIDSDRLPARLELRDQFHAFETELNRCEMVGYIMATLHCLHMTDILTPQYQQSLHKRRRPAGEATMRDHMPRMEHLPVKFVQVLTSLREKTNRSMPSVSVPEKITAEELRAFPSEAGQPDDEDDEGNPWDALDMDEFEGPSVGKAKASHAAPADPAAKASATAEEVDSSKAASTGVPSMENELKGTVIPQYAKGHVDKYRIMLDENINGEVVEHCVVNGHPFELVTKTCWEMEGADGLRYPNRMDRHKTKVNAVTRGQPGQDATAFDENMWLDLDDFFRMFNKMLPAGLNPMSVEELIALLYWDNKCRFEFQCIAGFQKATRKGLAYWPFRIRAVQGHTKRAMEAAAADDTFNAVEIYAVSGAAAIQKMSAKGKKITTPQRCPGVIYHRTTKGNWKGILKDGFVAGGGERNSSGRAHSYFSEIQVTEKEYISGLRAERPIEIRVAMAEAVRAGVLFFKTASDGILTTDVVPSQFIISIDDTEKKLNLYRRHEEVASSAQGSAGGTHVQDIVKTFEAKAGKRAGSKSPAASTGAPSEPAFFPGKVKPPPPNVAQLQGMPGYAHSRMMPPPPKGEAPKPPVAKDEGQSMPPKMTTATPPKEGASAPPLPDVPKAAPKAASGETVDEPAKKKAALASAPVAVPAAASAAVPAAPSSAAAFLEPTPKEKAKAKAKAPEAPKAAPPSGKPTSKTLVSKQKSRPKSDDQPSAKEEVQKPTSIKIETKQCERCFAETFKGQIQCDVCGLALEGMSKADRQKIAERRKAALHKIGLYYDHRGEYLQRITQSQLESLGLLDEQARGSTSPEADLLKRAKSRFERALSLGFISVAERFAQDATFAETVLNEGENEYDCQRYDLLRSAHLPKPSRTKAQVKMGVSEQSQLEHNAMRLVFLDFPSRRDMPQSFGYIDQPWIYMYRTELYSEEEYIEYMQRNPTHNLLLTCTGVHNVAVHDAQKHLDWIKGQNKELYEHNAEEKRRQSDRAREQNEAKRKAEMTGAYGQGPSKKGTTNPVARPSTATEVASSSTSASQWLNTPQQSHSHDDRHYTGEWQKWHGRWYEKVIRHGRIEWEEG